MKIIKGTNKNPKPDHLYCIFRSDEKGYSIGLVIRGDDANWRSREIIGYSELPIQINSAEYLKFRRTGEFPLFFDNE